MKRNHLALRSTSNADSVIALFRAYGFDQTHMASIFSQCPSLLSLDPSTDLKLKLKLKLDFFVHNGLSGDTLFHIVSTEPTILLINLQKQIVPCIDFLKNFRKDLASFFWIKRSTGFLLRFLDNVPHNVRSLQSYGVSDSKILKLIVEGESIVCRDVEWFGETLREMKDLGFDPKSSMFVDALIIFAKMKEEDWNAKLEMFKDGFGWTDEQVMAMYVKLSPVMSYSREKLMKAVENFITRLNWTADDIAEHPNLLAYCFEKRILPRFCLYQFLLVKGVVKEVSLNNVFSITEDRFLKKYQQEFPEVLELYRNTG